jgi:hypothetical protein
MASGGIQGVVVMIVALVFDPTFGSLVGERR